MLNSNKILGHTRIHYKDTLTPNAKEMKRDMEQYKTQVFRYICLRRSSLIGKLIEREPPI